VPFTHHFDRLDPNILNRLCVLARSAYSRAVARSVASLAAALIQFKIF